MPRSYHPLLTMATCSPLVRSTSGPQPAQATQTTSGSRRTRAVLTLAYWQRPRCVPGLVAIRKAAALHHGENGSSAGMRAILEHLHLDPMERLVARDFAGQKISQVRSAESEDARARVA